MLGSHRLWQKMCMYEEAVRTPLFLKFPRGFSPAIRSSNALVSGVDVLPTLCDYLQIAAPENVSGISLMPLIDGKEERLDRERIFIQFDGNGARGNFQRCVLEGFYKLIVDMFKDELFIELYDQQSDPLEMRNLAFLPEQHSRIDSMLSALRAHMRDTADMLTVPEDAYERFLSHYGPFQTHRK